MCGFTGLVGMTERQEPQEQAGSAGEGGAYLPTTRGERGHVEERVQSCCLRWVRYEVEKKGGYLVTGRAERRRWAKLLLGQKKKTKGKAGKDSRGRL